MDRARKSVDICNLQRNRSKEIAGGDPSGRSKGKQQVGTTSSSQSHNDWMTDYDRIDAMTDEQLHELLNQNQGRFYHQQNIPTIEEELEDDDTEEDVEGGGRNVGDGEEEHEEEDHGGITGGSEAVNTRKSKLKYPLFAQDHFKKTKDLKDRKYYAHCQHCSQILCMGTSGGYGTVQRHLNSRHPTEAAKLKGKGSQTQILRFANDQPFGNFSYNDEVHLKA
ncbi:unnamed protein product [Cuscuta europaea]|uniref:BED-type domain-containing protein n=1 Tax=Cuscuta europaea TaxID=41803 RepID=A0A9P0ZUP7_CUSEU|nr:unnamed protein product [Cuscuta europaea]